VHHHSEISRVAPAAADTSTQTSATWPNATNATNATVDVTAEPQEP
jgi:hypothetical protein